MGLDIGQISLSYSSPIRIFLGYPKKYPSFQSWNKNSEFYGVKKILLSITFSLCAEPFITKVSCCFNSLKVKGSTNIDFLTTLDDSSPLFWLIFFSNRKKIIRLNAGIVCLKSITDQLLFSGCCVSLRFLKTFYVIFLKYFISFPI